MSNREYKIAEIKARYSRDEILDMLLDYKEKSWENSSHKDLLEEIVRHYEDGCLSYNELSDDDLAERLVDERRWWGEME